MKDEDFLKIIFILKNGGNKEIQSLLNNYETNEYPIDENEKIRQNDFFTNKMEIINEEFGIVRNLPLNHQILTRNKKLSVENVVVKSETDQDSVGLIEIEK